MSCEQSREECKQFGSAGARWTGVLRSPACAYAVPISFEMGKRKERESEMKVRMNDNGCNEMNKNS